VRNSLSDRPHQLPVAISACDLKIEVTWIHDEI
jgi:hypothetical protein